MTAKAKHPGGRPMKYNNCMDLDAECEIYFESCHYEIDEWGDYVIGDDGNYVKLEKPIPYTITGLAMALKTSRRFLLNYEKKEEFFHTIKKHKLRVENYAEVGLHTKKAAGPIFALKNFKWTDKTEQEISGPGGKELNTTFIFIDPEAKK